MLSDLRQGLDPLGHLRNVGGDERMSETEARTDPRRYALDNMPPEHRETAKVAKAEALHRAACEIQDLLDILGIFYGDGPLFEAKKRVDDACTKARNVADRIRHPRRRIK